MASIRPALLSDLPVVATFLAGRLAGRGGAARYRRFFEYQWLTDKPDIGILLEHDGIVRGFAGAIYTRRVIRGRERAFCNLNSLVVDEGFRQFSLPMLNRFLDRPDYTFTCFSPSAPVVEILRFFKFRVADTVKRVFTPLAGLRFLRGRRARLYSGEDLAQRLEPEEMAILRDHAGYRCGHFLIEARGERCYFVTIRRGHDVRAFADVLYASNPALLADCIALAHWPVGAMHRTALIGIDGRFVEGRTRGAFTYGGVRPLAFRSPCLDANDIDALYSELVPMYG